MYTSAGRTGLVRVAVQPSDVVATPWPDLAGDSGEHVTQWSWWLQRVWSQDAVAEAVEAASPVLADRVRQLCDGRNVTARQLRSVVASMVRYLLRAECRATPFGLFAGVTAVRLGSALDLRYGQAHRAVARVDAAWLEAVITRLEGCDQLRRSLLVVANNLAFVRDGRLVMASQRQAAASPGTAPVEVSVRHTTAVQVVTEAAQAPVRVGDLVEKLTGGFPGTAVAVIEAMLGELLRQGFLISNLRPPMTATDPLAHVLSELAAVRAEEITETAETVRELRGIHQYLCLHDGASSPARAREVRASVASAMTAVHAAEHPVSVDVRADCAVVSPSPGP